MGLKAWRGTGAEAALLERTASDDELEMREVQQNLGRTFAVYYRSSISSHIR